jgi:hypothetical protein
MVLWSFATLARKPHIQMTPCCYFCNCIFCYCKFDTSLMLSLAKYFIEKGFGGTKPLFYILYIHTHSLITFAEFRSKNVFGRFFEDAFALYLLYNRRTFTNQQYIFVQCTKRQFVGNAKFLRDMPRFFVQCCKLFSRKSGHN